MPTLNLPHNIWFAAQVRQAREKSVSLMLRTYGYEEFVPMRIWRRRWSDRIKTGEAPLFPGYVFFRVQESVDAKVCSVPNVIRIVGIGNQPASIHDEEIVAIQRAIGSGRPVVPAAYLQTGDLVRVVSGALSGLEGCLLRRKEGHRLVLSVNLLQRAIAVEIDEADVDPIGHAHAVR